MKHERFLSKYSGSLNEVAVDVAMLQYDVTAEFLENLAEDLLRQAAGDKSKGRNKLASRLELAASKIMEAKDEMDKAWNICKPYMKN